MKTLPRLSLLLIWVFSLSCTHSSPTTRTSDRYAATPYLSPSAVDVLSILPPPPVASSEEHRRELFLLHQIEHDRTPAQAAQVKFDNTLTVFNFADVISPRFTAANCPKTAKFFDLMEMDEGHFARVGKLYYHRARPATEDPTLSPVMPQGGFCYPSGHSTRATFFAELLASLFPDKREALMNRSQEIGFGREIAGVHFPSDVLAGRTLGHAIAHAFLSSPAARAALNELRPEIQSIIIAQPH